MSEKITILITRDRELSNVVLWLLLNYLNFMFIEHINPVFWYKLLKTSQEVCTLCTNLWLKSKQIIEQSIPMQENSIPTIFLPGSLTDDWQQDG